MVIEEKLATNYEASTRLKAFLALLKARLTALVVFSGATGYLMATNGNLEWIPFTGFLIGSFLITGAANTINQIIEKDLDKLMKRTANRPIPVGTITQVEASFFALLCAFIGTVILLTFTTQIATAIAILSLVLYGFVYTPMKQKSPIAVLIGAFPGAFPPLIGWAAASGVVGIEALVLFGVQFIWQFPHFWAIAWVGHTDYTNAGFKMLPSKRGKNFNSAIQIFIYTLFLLPVGLLPLQFGMSGTTSAIIAGVCGLLFSWQSFRFFMNRTDKNALRIMFASFFYLPIVQIAFLIDKI